MGAHFMTAYLPVATFRPKPARIPVRVYTISLFWKAVYIVMGSATAMAGALGVVFFLLDEGAPGGFMGKALAVACGALVLSGCSLIVHSLVYKFILGPKEIAVSGLLGHRRMRRSDILGRRTQRSTGITVVRLFPAREGGAKIALIQDLKTDRAYRNWLASLPDLDERQDANTIRGFLEHRLAPENRAYEGPATGLEAELEDRMSGEAADNRERTFRAAQAGAGVLNGLASVLALWFLFFPKPYGFLVAMTAALPPIAMAMTLASRGLFSLDEAPKILRGGRPSLSLCFVLPAIALTARAWLDAALLDWKIALGAGAAAGVVVSAIAIGGMIWGAGVRLAPRGLLMIAAVIAIWCEGIVVHGDSLLDRGGATGYEVRVSDKNQMLAKLKIRRFTLEPWGPVAEAASVAAPNQALYDRINPGDTVCVILHPGAFRMRWVEVWGCR